MLFKCGLKTYFYKLSRPSHKRCPRLRFISLNWYRPNGTSPAAWLIDWLIDVGPKCLGILRPGFEVSRDISDLGSKCLESEVPRVRSVRLPSRDWLIDWLLAESRRIRKAADVVHRRSLPVVRHRRLAQSRRPGRLRPARQFTATASWSSVNVFVRESAMWPTTW